MKGVAVTDRISMRGRAALITGAGSAQGIGFATARIIGARGGSVAITSTTDRIFEREAELAAEGIEVAAFTADLANETDAGNLVSAASERFGRLDALVNNAGMVQTGGDLLSKRFTDITGEEFARELQLNLWTAFHATRAALPRMLEAGYGRIVMVSSVTGPLSMNPGDGGYGTAKAAMDGMMRAVAIETAAQGVTVNSVAPGWIATASTTAQEDIAAANTPIGRGGRPEEVGELIAFLASEASSYVTGQSIVVDGGNAIQEYKGPPGDWY